MLSLNMKLNMMELVEHLYAQLSKDDLQKLILRLDERAMNFKFTSALTHAFVARMSEKLTQVKDQFLNKDAGITITSIGQIIRDIRKQRGIRQYDLAQRSGIQQPSLSRIENSEVSPRMGTLQSIAKALDLRVALSLEAKGPGNGKA